MARGYSLISQGVWQQPARPVFWSETDPQLDIGIAAVNMTVHNVVTQFDNTSYTYYYYYTMFDNTGTT